MHAYRKSFSATMLLVVMFSVIGPTSAQEKPANQFKQVATFGQHEEKTASIWFGDIDGDGDQDVVLANGRHWPGQNRIFINDGKGDFSVERNLIDQKDKTYATPLADLDGDGDLDVVVGNDRQPSYVLLNDGKGNFRKSQQIGGLFPTRSITLADIDKRNGIDILVTNRGEPNQIFFNDGKANFKKSKQFGARKDSTIDVAIADLNGDGHNDLALANRDGQQNMVYFGDGRGEFPESAKYGSGTDETRGVAVADFDQDGKLDILNANIGEPNAIYFGDGKGGFQRRAKFGGNANSYHLQCVRLNRDDKELAIIVANVGSQNAIYVHSDKGLFKKSLFGGKPTLFGFGRSAATYCVAAADIDGDGVIEIATANSDDLNRLFKYVNNEK